MPGPQSGYLHLALRSRTPDPFTLKQAPEGAVRLAIEHRFACFPRPGLPKTLLYWSASIASRLVILEHVQASSREG